MTRDTHRPTASGVVVIGGSAGAIPPLRDIISQLPADFPAAVVVVQHSVPTRHSLLAAILSRDSAMAVMEAVDGGPLYAGTVYVVPPDRHAHLTATVPAPWLWCSAEAGWTLPMAYRPSGEPVAP